VIDGDGLVGRGSTDVEGGELAGGLVDAVGRGAVVDIGGDDEGIGGGSIGMAEGAVAEGAGRKAQVEWRLDGVDAKVVVFEDDAYEGRLVFACGVPGAASRGSGGTQAKAFVVRTAVDVREASAARRGRTDAVGVLVAHECAVAVGGEAADGTRRREYVELVVAPSDPFEVVACARVEGEDGGARGAVGGAVKDVDAPECDSAVL
jgi:hypothetical protein